MTLGITVVDGPVPQDMGSGFCHCFSSESPGVATQKVSRVGQVLHLNIFPERRHRVSLSWYMASKSALGRWHANAQRVD